MDGIITDISDERAVIETSDGEKHKFLLRRFKYDNPDVADEVVIRKGPKGAEIYLKGEEEEEEPEKPKKTRKRQRSEDEYDEEDETFSDGKDHLGLAGFVFAVASFLPFGGLVNAVIALFICLKAKKSGDKLGRAGFLIATIRCIISSIIIIIMLIIGGSAISKVKDSLNLLNSLTGTGSTESSSGESNWIVNGKSYDDGSTDSYTENDSTEESTDGLSGGTDSSDSSTDSMDTSGTSDDLTQTTP
ncbi:MAG: hypothetical protein ACI4CS_08155 [Candidatus Weimeria sp.]